MCGRTVQTLGAVNAASSSLLKIQSSIYQGGLVDNIGPRETTAYSRNDSDDKSGNHANGVGASFSQTNTSEDAAVTTTNSSSGEQVCPWRDNFNLSPGHDAVVFTINRQTGELQMDRKFWGLVTRGGTTKQPLAEGASKHYSNQMFNARSDTLYSKPTFSKLLNQDQGRTCLVAVDGFFEWHADALAAGKGKKQPYFVFRRNTINKNYKSEQSRPYLLMAGLWTSVPTGYSPPKPSTLDTFSILTTEVCSPLTWLHSRMPVCVWDEELAMKWLQQPSSKLLNQLDQGANQTQESMLQWHAVTTQMSSTKFRSPDSVKAIPKERSVKSFFAPAGKKVNNSSSSSSSSSKNQSIKTEGKQEVQEKKPTRTASGAVGNTVSGTKRSPSSNHAKNSPYPNKSKKQKTNPKSPKRGTITAFFSAKKPEGRK